MLLLISGDAEIFVNVKSRNDRGRTSYTPVIEKAKGTVFKSAICNLKKDILHLYVKPLGH